jgi:hypothetical protein
MLVEQVSFFIDGRANRRNSFPTLSNDTTKIYGCAGSSWAGIVYIWV